MSSGTARGLGRTGTVSYTVSWIFRISAHRVFDEMSTRNKNSNFRNFQIGLVIILDGDSETIFVRSRGGVLLKT
jgi:hypothetical protein